MDQRTIVFETNTSMRGMLKDNQIDLSNFKPQRIPARFKKYLNIEYVEEYRYYSFKNNIIGLLWDDDTGNEFTNNKVLFDVGAIYKETLLGALSFAFALRKKLLCFDSNFKILMSCDDNFITISFFQIRPGNSFFDENLESYNEEALLIITITS